MPVMTPWMVCAGSDWMCAVVPPYHSDACPTNTVSAAIADHSDMESSFPDVKDMYLSLRWTTEQPCLNDRNQVRIQPVDATV